jgi:hypothetical protein
MMFSKLRLHWERSAETAVGQSCSHNGRLAELWIDGKNWNLCIQSLTRIQPNERWDASVRWSIKDCPLVDQAILKAEEILTAEWQLDLGAV